MAGNIKFYKSSLKMQLKSGTQYRTSFFMQLAANFAMTGSELAGVGVLLARFGPAGGWSSGEIMLFFGMMYFCFGTVELFGRGFTSFATHIRTGTFDRMLARPKPVFLQVAGSMLDLRRLGSIIIGITVFAYGAASAAVTWNILKLTALIIGVLCGMALFCGFFILEAAISFKTVQNIELMNILTYGGKTAGAYPVDLYPKGMRFALFYIIPYGLAMQLPLSFITGRPMLGLPVWSAFILPFAGFVFFTICCKIWYAGMKAYSSTGS